MGLSEDFMSLFEGRPDAVGTEEGGALRRPADAMPWWWSAQISKHLDGTAPCGVYPLVPDVAPQVTPMWLVKWGCIDFDEGDTESWTHAWNVHEVLHQLGVASWVEKSRSKGYHVWVFLQDWMEARLVREALLGACQVVDAPTKEINPKSVGFDDPATLGNYVRLCYPGGLSDALRELEPRELGMAGWADGGRGLLLHQAGQRQAASDRPGSADDRRGRGSQGEEDRWRGWLCHSCGSLVALPRQGVEGHLPMAGPGSPGRSGSNVGAVPVDGRAQAGVDQSLPRRVVLSSSSPEQPLCLSCFVTQAERHLASLEDMKRLQALYEPPRRVVPVRPAAGLLEGDIYKRMGGLAWTILQEGPREGMGRGHTLYKLACLLVEGGRHTPDEVYQLCWEADQAWGKFHVRPNGEAQVLRVVERAYGG